jgi:hypothetical protein
VTRHQPSAVVSRYIPSLCRKEADFGLRDVEDDGDDVVEIRGGGVDIPEILYLGD